MREPASIEKGTLCHAWFQRMFGGLADGLFMGRGGDRFAFPAATIALECLERIHRWALDGDGCGAIEGVLDELAGVYLLYGGDPEQARRLPRMMKETAAEDRPGAGSDGSGRDNLCERFDLLCDAADRAVERYFRVLEKIRAADRERLVFRNRKEAVR